MILLESEASLRREEYIAPPENLKHWEVATTTKGPRAG